jgi:hypothetical protein
MKSCGFSDRHGFGPTRKWVEDGKHVAHLAPLVGHVRLAPVAGRSARPGGTTASALGAIARVGLRWHGVRAVGSER